MALKALRIFTREHEGSSQLKSLYGLTPLVRLAKFNAEHSDIREFFYGGNTPQEQIDGMHLTVNTIIQEVFIVM